MSRLALVENTTLNKDVINSFMGIYILDVRRNCGYTRVVGRHLTLHHFYSTLFYGWEENKGHDFYSRM